MRAHTIFCGGGGVGGVKIETFGKKVENIYCGATKIFYKNYNKWEPQKQKDF